MPMKKVQIDWHFQVVRAHVWDILSSYIVDIYILDCSQTRITQRQNHRELISNNNLSVLFGFKNCESNNE